MSLRSCLFASLLLCATAVHAHPPPAEAPARVPRAIHHAAFETAMRRALAAEAGKAVAGFKVLHVSGDVGPWLDTGLDLRPGDRVSLLSAGTFWLSRAYGLSLAPAMALWGRIGSDGEIFRGLRDTQTFDAATAGTLRLKLFPALKWRDRHGAYEGEPAPANPDSGGGISVAVIRWAPDADIPAVLARMAGGNDEAALLRAESERLRERGVEVPPGWTHLWELGRSEIFSVAQRPPGQPGGEPEATIAVRTRGDVGILQKDVDFALTPDTVLSWEWLLERLPSGVAENSVPTHDYLSIAVEFDNGRDLTFMWSHSLPVGESFPCPLPAWHARETHVVARSGTAELGKWLPEAFNVADAYRSAIGGPLPGRIVRVWLIANSVFQQREGEGRFARIALRDGRTTLAVR